MIYFFLLLLSFTLTYFIKNYYIKNALFDLVNERSSHTVPTPHGGGIAIALTWFIGIFYLYFFEQIETQLFYALLMGFFISLISFFDDLYDLSSKIRLFVQAAVAMLGLYFLNGFEELDFFFFSINNQIITNLFAFLMIIWFINLYNFLDGLDGYAGSEALFLSLAAFTLFHNNVFLILAVAVLGFLVWNWHKAKIFMGDVGSTLLGYNVAIFTIYYANQEGENFWIWIILFSPFWFDATWTLFRRARKKEKLSQAHKKHAYQRLMQSGWSHSKVVISLTVLNIILLILLSIFLNLFLVFVTTMTLLYLSIKYIDTKKAFI